MFGMKDAMTEEMIYSVNVDRKHDMDMFVNGWQRIVDNLFRQVKDIK